MKWVRYNNIYKSLTQPFLAKHILLLQSLVLEFIVLKVLLFCQMLHADHFHIFLDSFRLHITQPRANLRAGITCRALGFKPIRVGNANFERVFHRNYCLNNFNQTFMGKEELSQEHLSVRFFIYTFVGTVLGS